jgi:hypothetical protein
VLVGAARSPRAVHETADAGDVVIDIDIDPPPFVEVR